MEKYSNEELCALAKAGDLTAMAVLAERNLPFAKSQVNRFLNKTPVNDIGHYVESDDLLQEAMIAMLRAVDRYDPALEVKFLTFAGRLMRNAIVDTYRTALHLRLIPVDLRKIRDGTEVPEREPSICDKERTFRNERRMDDYVDVEKGTTGGRDTGIDGAASGFLYDPESVCLHMETIIEVDTALERVPIRSRLFLEYSFGFDEDDTERTVQEAAQHFHLGVRRAKQLRQSALHDVRRELYRRRKPRMKTDADSKVKTHQTHAEHAEF